MKPYLNIGIFKDLKDLEMFHTVRVCFSSIAWSNNADMDPEMLYHQSIPV